MLRRPTSKLRKRAIVVSLALSVMGLPALADGPTTRTIPRNSAGVDTSRIVAIGGDVTEIIYKLGAGKNIVAVDATSQFPPDALKTKQNVGYMRALSSEGVLSTRPSLIIASDGAGPPEVTRALKSAAIPYVTVDGKDTADGLRLKVNQIAAALGLTPLGKKLVSEIDTKLSKLDERRKTISKTKSVLFILAARDGRAIVGGNETSADAIIELAGARNAVSNLTGFKPLTDEALIGASPDAIIVMKRGDGSKSHEDALALPGVKLTPAGKTKQIFVMDGVYLIGFGPRMPDAANDLMTKLYSRDATDANGQGVN
ncbi:MAG: ABC transporter substrate-binding protein [Pseudomonadota bacterium]